MSGLARNGVIRVNEDVKRDAELILTELGLSVATAVEIFFRQISRDKKFPFVISKIDTPNKLTVRAIHDANNETDLQGPFNNVEDLMEHLNV